MLQLGQCILAMGSICDTSAAGDGHPHLEVTRSIFGEPTFVNVITEDKGQERRNEVVLQSQM